MDYRTLGRTGVRVSPLCLGCMNFGDGADEAESFAIIDQAMDAGINFLDTADVYGRGVSETIVGKALARDGKRDRVFLATKGYNKMDDTDPNAWGSHRYHLVKACEDSLRRLGTDHVDLYQMHRPQPSVPIDETLRALDDLVKAGKVRYVGHQHVRRVAVDGEPVGVQRARPQPVRLRAAAVQPAGPADRARTAALLPDVWPGRDPLGAHRGRPAVGQVQAGPASPRRRTLRKGRVQQPGQRHGPDRRRPVRGVLRGAERRPRPLRPGLVPRPARRHLARSSARAAGSRWTPTCRRCR